MCVCVCVCVCGGEGRGKKVGWIYCHLLLCDTGDVMAVTCLLGTRYDMMLIELWNGIVRNVVSLGL